MSMSSSESSSAPTAPSSKTGQSPPEKAQKGSKDKKKKENKEPNRGEDFGSKKLKDSLSSSTHKGVRKSEKSGKPGKDKDGGLEKEKSKKHKEKENKDKKNKDADLKEEKEEEKVEWATDPLELANQQKIGRVIELLERLKKDDPNRKHILVEYFIQDIGDLDSVEQSMPIDITTQYWWIDRDLIGKSDGEFEVDDFAYKLDIALSPALEMERLVEEGNANHSIWTTKAPGFGSYSDHGIVTSWQRFKGAIKCPLYLQDFPFDAQQVQFYFASESEDSKAVTLIDITNSDGLEGMKDNLLMNEWKLRGFYMSKVVFVLVLLGIIMSAAMVVPADLLNDRLQISITLLLATVAFNFVTSDLLPKISYTTWLDVYFIGIYIFLVISIAEHIAAFKVFENYGRRIATTFDYWAIGAFLFSFAIWTIVFVARGLKQHKLVAKKQESGASKKKAKATAPPEKKEV